MAAPVPMQRWWEGSIQQTHESTLQAITQAWNSLVRVIAGDFLIWRQESHSALSGYTRYVSGYKLGVLDLSLREESDKEEEDSEEASSANESSDDATKSDSDDGEEDELETLSRDKSHGGDSDEHDESDKGRSESEFSWRTGHSSNNENFSDDDDKGSQSDADVHENIDDLDDDDNDTHDTSDSEDDGNESDIDEEENDSKHKNDEERNGKDDDDDDGTDSSDADDSDDDESTSSENTFSTTIPMTTVTTTAAATSLSTSSTATTTSTLRTTSDAPSTRIPITSSKTSTPSSLQTLPLPNRRPSSLNPRCNDQKSCLEARESDCTRCYAERSTSREKCHQLANLLFKSSSPYSPGDVPRIKSALYSQRRRVNGLVPDEHSSYCFGGMHRMTNTIFELDIGGVDEINAEGARCMLLDNLHDQKEEVIVSNSTVLYNVGTTFENIVPFAPVQRRLIGALRKPTHAKIVLSTNAEIRQTILKNALALLSKSPKWNDVFQENVDNFEIIVIDGLVYVILIPFTTEFSDEVGSL